MEQSIKAELVHSQCGTRPTFEASYSVSSPNTPRPVSLSNVSGRPLKSEHLEVGLVNTKGGRDSPFAVIGCDKDTVVSSSTVSFAKMQSRRPALAIPDGVIEPTILPCAL